MAAFEAEWLIWRERPECGSDRYRRTVCRKDGVTGADRFAGAEWITRVSGVPLLADALAAIDCEVEHIIECHSHAIVIGRPLDMQLSQWTAALAYWQGQYVAIGRSKDKVKLAQVSLPAACTPRKA
jgi:flavin reductase (DIM6/NTAB) family NADH-FMN oxidoreductase RutF